MKTCTVCGKLRPLGRTLMVRGLVTVPDFAYVCAGACWRSAVDATSIYCADYRAHQLDHHWTADGWRCSKCTPEAAA